MRSHHEHADNLLSRLFSYSPRESREPLEDYCTEALAWCLRNSKELCNEFLKLTKVAPLGNGIDGVEIHTQLPFKTSDEKNRDAEARGRFDLVIESGNITQSFVVVVEVKVGSPFGEKQLEIYRKELKKSAEFVGVPQVTRYLVTLTTMPHSLPWTDARITWPEVHRAISNLIDGSNIKQNDAVVAEVLKQFVSFLKQKGLSTLELHKTSGKLLGQWYEVKKLEKQLKEIIERLRNQEAIKPIVGRRQVQSGDEVWTGVYGKYDFFAGFGILNMNGVPELFMHVEITVPGDQRKCVERFDQEGKDALESAKRYQERYQDQLQERWLEDMVNFGKTVDGKSWFVFSKQVAGALDGDGEAVFQWLDRMAKLAIGLIKKAQPAK